MDFVRKEASVQITIQRYLIKEILNIQRRLSKEVGEVL